MKKFKFIDLFCWIWGFRIAMESLWWECVFSCDIDRAVQETYHENFWEWPEWDITKIDPKTIPDHDILCAWFPCQPFSIAGKRLWFEDTRWTMFFYVAEILKEKNPKGFILENVKWLVNHDGWRTFSRIIDILQELDYDVSYKVLNATSFWVPQNRERIVIVWLKKWLLRGKEFKFPSKDVKLTPLEEIIDLWNKKEDITEICKNNIYFHLEHKEKPRVLYNSKKIVFAYEIRKSKCAFKWWNIAPCLTAKMWTGWNNVPVIVWLNRKITVEEWLKLMWFPNWYKIKNSAQWYKQIWNSVVIPMIKWVSEELIRFI